MLFYELGNFTRNKSDKIYDDAKVAVIDESGYRRYLTGMEYNERELAFVVPDYPNEYEDGMSAKQLLDKVSTLKATGFDGRVVVFEDMDFAREAEPIKGWVDDDDYSIIFDTDYWQNKSARTAATPS